MDTIVIDEASCVSTKMLWQVHERLCCISNKEIKFGGFSIIMVGDFYQLPPVRTSGSSLIYGASSSAHSKTIGINDFCFFDLTEQHRAVGTSQEDVMHQEMLKDLRDPDKCATAFKNLLQRAQFVTESIPDNAFMLESTNQEREILSLLRSREFALTKGIPVLKVSIKGAQYFSVTGKPTMCLANLSRENRLINGTLMEEDGVLVGNENEKARLTKYVKENGRAGEILDCTSFAIVGIAATTIDGRVSAEFKKSDLDDELEIGCGFSFTIHKVQGATINNNLCIDLN